VLNEPGGAGSWFLTSGGASPSGSGKVDPAHAGAGQFATSGGNGPGAHALVSPPHLVAPGEALSFDFFSSNSAAFGILDTMDFGSAGNQQARRRGGAPPRSPRRACQPNPKPLTRRAAKAPAASQARAGLYNASASTAAGLAAFLFLNSSATAGPFLGSVLSAAQVQANNDAGWMTATAPLAPYVGASVYLVFRETDSVLDFDFGAPRCLPAPLGARSPGARAGAGAAAGGAHAEPGTR
jgi:hypothetical protein